jgi:Cd(II)/Pb(II)-responsive transcriptional regulator
MKIGELALATDTPVQTIRYYEQEALLPAPARTASNYRVYDEGHAQRLAFIRHCRSLDMSLTEIRVLLEFKDGPTRACGEVNELLDAHIGHVARRIADLRALQKQLQELRNRCNATSQSADCGILAGLSDAALAAPAPRKRRVHLAGAHPAGPAKTGAAG